MNANRVGKLLVLLNVVLSMLAMSWAGAIFFQQLDWGWMEPRKDITGTVRVPSEIDQRHAAVMEEHKAIQLLMPALAAAEAAVPDAQARFYQNHNWYREQLARLRHDPAVPLEIKDIEFKDGSVVLEKGKDTGKPVLGQAVPELTKSYDSYAKELKEVQKSIDDMVDAIGKTIEEKEKVLTLNLTGVKGTRPGLYDLVGDEYQDQVRTKFEIEYVRPQWVDALRAVGQYRERRQLLQDTLARLKKGRTETKK